MKKEPTKTEDTSVATKQKAPFKKGQEINVDMVSALGKADPDKAVSATILEVITHAKTGEYAGQLLVKLANGKTGVVSDARVVTLI